MLFIDPDHDDHYDGSGDLDLDDLIFIIDWFFHRIIGLLFRDEYIV